jgi:hypothetical protein
MNCYEDNATAASVHKESMHLAQKASSLWPLMFQFTAEAAAFGLIRISHQFLGTLFRVFLVFPFTGAVHGFVTKILQVLGR